MPSEIKIPRGYRLDRRRETSSNFRPSPDGPIREATEETLYAVPKDGYRSGLSENFAAKPVKPGELATQRFGPDEISIRDFGDNERIVFASGVVVTEDKEGKDPQVIITSPTGEEISRSPGQIYGGVGNISFDTQSYSFTRDGKMSVVSEEKTGYYTKKNHAVTIDPGTGESSAYWTKYDEIRSWSDQYGEDGPTKYAQEATYENGVVNLGTNKQLTKFGLHIHPEWLVPGGYPT